MRRWVSIITAVSLAGCASKSADVAPAYISPLTYQSFTCQQLTAEAQRVSAAAAAAAGAAAEAGGGAARNWIPQFF